MAIFSLNAALDLGSVSTSVRATPEGELITQPSYVAVSADGHEIVAVGEEAKSLTGRLLGGIVVKRPIKNGVITDTELVEVMIKYFLKNTLKTSITKGISKMTMAIPCDSNELEKAAMESTGFHAGAREVYLIETPIAAALGSGVDIFSNSGVLVVDIGAQKSDIGMVSLGGLVYGGTTKVAGDTFSEVILNYMRDSLGVIVGENTAEHIKVEIGGVNSSKNTKIINVRGRSIENGMPMEVQVGNLEIVQGMRNVADKLCTDIKEVISQIPPEFAADIIDNGILLTGKGALLEGIAEFISENTGIKTCISDNTADAVIDGLYMSIERIGKKGLRSNFETA
ncbi:MAG: rod shape-determining protein [Eubacteriales bacterium]